MASIPTEEVYDLLILVDATYSMSNYLESLQSSLPKVIAVSNLTNSFARIGLLAYRDYTEAHREVNGILDWSGWYDPNGSADGPDAVTAHGLMNKAASLEPIGGGDYPEATKTGLARAYSLMREEATTIILLYTDAPPQCWMVADKDRDSNYFAEQAALKRTSSYSGFGPHFADWTDTCKQLHQGPRKAHVFCFLDESLERMVLNAGYYIYLSTVTRGACFYMTDAKPLSIAQVTVDVLLAWMGTAKVGAEKAYLPAKLVRYKGGDGIKRIKDEKDENANSYFWASGGDSRVALIRDAQETKLKKQMHANLAQVGVNSDALKKFLPKRKTPVTDFSQRYARDEQFKAVVVKQLKYIIETDVTSMSLNPVFGSLWRAVCNDRDNPARDELITAFGLYVDKIRDTDEKAQMKAWLEESYDYAAEILATLETVPEDQRFPCVFLDPTIDFKPAKKKGEKEDEDESEDEREITAFRRDELLEIGRSCDGRILRRLGKILTRITYVELAADLPAHIAATSNIEVPKIPVVLASKQHGWKFWKVLLHTVLPGTMLSARPAVVVAALAIRIGLKPLFGVACAAMLSWRNNWNTLEVPETWNPSCLGLLLDADAEYRKQMKDKGQEIGPEEDGLLLSTDRELFALLVAYKMAEANLLSTLTVEIGWTPQKTNVPVGCVVRCRECEYPRSISIMAEKSGGKCGLCLAKDWRDAEHKNRGLSNNVTEGDNETSEATWVECAVRTCRAQYVCYNPSDLNVRPKCHYCRLQSSLPLDKRSDNPAPSLECEKCLSKVIWPSEWRSLAPAPFHCTACLNSRKTIITVESNAEQISRENGQAWLLHNGDNALKEPFKRTLFHTISTVGPDTFLKKIRILPKLDPDPVLTLNGKRIRNQAALKTQIESWIRRRTSEKGLCSLCFSSFQHSRLLPACRRHGCHQNICEGCLNGWYGLNRPGMIINAAALFCPFCRRPPVARTLAAYGKGIHAVGDLTAAMRERGRWIHAWCYDCGKARRIMERECARGAPEPVEQWKCEYCQLSDLEKARIAEREARRTVALARRLNEEEHADAQRRLEQAIRRRRELEVPVKECPGCQTPTQKTYGCDHMQCIVRHCGVHWCWACGKKFESTDIYNHMSNAHGSYYAGGLGLGQEFSDDGDDY